MHRRYVTLQKQKPILIPDNILLEYLSVEQLEVFSASGTGIFSVTIYAEKPGGDPRGGYVLLHFDATTREPERGVCSFRI